MTDPAFRPLSDRLLVRRDDAATTSGRLVIPESARDRLSRGVVLRMGPEVAASELRPGAVVVWARFAGDEVTVDGLAYVVLRESEILGVDGE